MRPTPLPLPDKAPPEEGKKLKEEESEGEPAKLVLPRGTRRNHLYNRWANCLIWRETLHTDQHETFLQEGGYGTLGNLSRSSRSISEAMFLSFRGSLKVRRIASRVAARVESLKAFLIPSKSKAASLHRRLVRHIR